MEVWSQDPTESTQDTRPASYGIPCILPQNLPAAFSNSKGHTICSFLLIMKTVLGEFKEKKRKLVWETYLSNLSVFITVTRMTFSLRLMVLERWRWDHGLSSQLLKRLTWERLQEKGLGYFVSVVFCDGRTFTSSTETDKDGTGCWLGHYPTATSLIKAWWWWPCLQRARWKGSGDKVCCILLGKQTRLHTNLIFLFGEGSTYVHHLSPWELMYACPL